MAMQSRGRATRTAGGHVSKEQHKPPPPKGHAGDRQSQQHSLRNTTTHPPSPDDNNVEPPAKRRKLSIRSKQTTLDDFVNAKSGEVKPPTKVTVAHPRGQLLETINGVRTILDAAEDEVCRLTPRSGTPRSTGRVPQPELQLSTNVPKQEDKRTLRSQDDGPRLKSELAIYFPNYEDIIFDVAKETEFITVDTTIYITDDVVKQTKPDQTSPTKGSKNAKTSSAHARKGSVNGIHPSTPLRTSSNHFNGSPSLNLEMFSRNLPDQPEDPLTDDHFLKSHRRAERKEKQLRNIEKERAMHEKVQLDRLLEGLKGHDWLKTLGITGITDGEAKKYEQKRDYFIAEVQALVDKFKLWREQERKQKLDREAAAARQEEEQEIDDVASEESSMGPPSSDLNASAARQLQQETVSALKSSALKLQKVQDSPKPKPPIQFVAPPPEIPITSFYDKRHLRDAALGKARHGRNVYAFGQPVPEMESREFELPEEYVSEDTLRAKARDKRRRKRASVVDASVA